LAAGIAATGSAIIPPDDAGRGEAVLLERFRDGAPKVDRHQSGAAKKQGRSCNAN
jgi:hypothetical protein